MQCVTFIMFAAIVAMAVSEGQYYVPRAYYIIDAEGHASAPVPLRRLRRSLNPYPIPYANAGSAGAKANANANAQAQGWGGNANANANAHAIAGARGPGAGGWDLPSWSYGSSKPNTLSADESRRQFGLQLGGRSVSASTSVGVDSSGKGYYDQYASVLK